ncbi:MAG: divalent-cation tolerance protein CutA [Nitrosomonas sp.]|nr:divalent-cation tolerance protein CutA [Nitrosomonas sp.]
MMTEKVTTSQSLMILTNYPDEASAKALADCLIGDRLAACVNIFPVCRSLYRWQSQLRETEEVPVMIKTTAGHYSAVEKTIKALHPYELPEILAVSFDKASPAYSQWVIDETN